MRIKMFAGNIHILRDFDFTKHVQPNVPRNALKGNQG